MGMDKSAWAFGLALCVVAAGAHAQTTAAGHAKPKTPHAPAVAASAPRFTIERTPAWVKPLAWDPAAPIAAAPYQFLVAEEQVRVSDGGVERYWHTLRQINDTSALQQGGQIELDFDPAYQHLVFHKIEIVRGTQRIDKLDAAKVRLLQREPQLERQMIDGRVTASIVLDDLRAGDRVDWSASVVGDNPVFAGRFVSTTWDAYGNAPIGTWQLRVLAPAGRDIHVQVGDPAVTTSSSVHEGVRETLFRHVNVPQMQVDEHMPPAEFLKAQVELSEFADWQDVAAWAARLFARAMQASPAVDAQVAALQAKAGGDRDALLRATLDFVQRDIRYFGTESGIDSHQPALADTVLRQRFGDCKDKVALLAELLARMGFDATPVIVSANYRAASRLRVVGPLAFDHAIVRVMVDGKPVFLDATRSEQTGAIAAREALDLGWGLLARAGETALTELPSGRDKVQAETIDTFSFPKLAKEGTLTSVSILHGAGAEWFRASLASQPRAEIEKAVQGETVRAYPSLVASGPTEFVTVSEDNTVKITSHYRTGDYWTLPEGRALAGRYVLSGLVAPLRLPDQARRTHAFRITPGRYLHQVVYGFGETTPGAPRNAHFDEVNKVFELHTRSDTQAQRQVMDGELHVLTDTVPAADWQAHRDKINKIVSHLAGNAVVSPFSVAQYDAFRAEGDALMVRLRKGELKVNSRAQAAAMMGLVADDRILDSDRLPPALRAKMLLSKATRLDDLDRLDLAKGAFDASLVLDPTNADTHEALAANAVFRKNDGEALKEAAEAIRLSPPRPKANAIRGWAHFFGGDPAAARDDFIAALQSREEVEHSYDAIWLYLATRRAGGDGVKAVQGYEPTSSYPEWPFSVLQLMEGRVTFDAALAASQEDGQRNAGRESELYFFAGEKAVADGDLATARKYLRLSVATGMSEYVEYHAAQRELARIGDR